MVKAEAKVMIVECWWRLIGGGGKRKDIGGQYSEKGKVAATSEYIEPASLSPSGCYCHKLNMDGQARESTLRWWPSGGK